VRRRHRSIEIPFRYPLRFEALCLSYSWNDATIGDVEFAETPPVLIFRHSPQPSGTIAICGHAWFHTAI
jgi:hypothetical protein